jgi:hypothetical protein
MGKFKYEEKVVVIEGFYEGQWGYVRKESNWFWIKRYLVYCNSTYQWFKESELRSLDRPNKEFDDKLKAEIEK